MRSLRVTWGQARLLEVTLGRKSKLTAKNSSLIPAKISSSFERIEIKSFVLSIAWTFWNPTFSMILPKNKLNYSRSTEVTKSQERSVENPRKRLCPNDFWELPKWPLQWMSWSNCPKIGLLKSGHCWGHSRSLEVECNTNHSWQRNADDILSA